MRMIKAIAVFSMVSQILIADELYLTPQSTNVITNDSLSVSRYLLYFPEIDFDIVHLIDSVVISIPLTDCDPLLDDKKIEISTLLTQWNESVVTWTYPWDKPGGDLDEFRVSGVVDISEGMLIFNLSPLYVALYQGYVYDYGYLIRLHNENGVQLYLPYIEESFIRSSPKSSVKWFK